MCPFTALTFCLFLEWVKSKVKQLFTMLLLCADHHHFYFLICVHTCVFCSRTFATFRAVLEFAACHGCIEFSAKRGTKLLQKRREKIVSSLPA